jgi:hypothetical protein
VAARLGYEPFVEQSDSKLSVEFARERAELVGRVKLTSTSGESRGQRTLRSADADCVELSTSVALAVALALDPEAVRGQNPEPAELAPSASSPPPPPVASALPRTTREVPQKDASFEHRQAPTALGFRIDAGVIGGTGIVPAVNIGPRAAAALASRSWSVAVEGSALVPGTKTASFGDVTASVVYGSLVPCIHPVAQTVRLDACVAASIGALFAQATSVTRSFPTTNVYAALGPRVGITITPLPWVGFGVAIDIPVALSRTHLVIDDRGTPREVWTSPAVGFLGGLSAEFRFR